METKDDAPKLGRLLKTVKDPYKPFRKNMILRVREIIVIVRFAVAVIFFNLGPVSVSVFPCPLGVTHNPVRIPIPDIEINPSH